MSIRMCFLINIILFSPFFLCTVGTAKAMNCALIQEFCQSQPSFARCYNEKIRTCIFGRHASPDFKQKDGKMNTIYGHVVQIPSEALQKSRNNNNTENVKMIVSVLNSSFFRMDLSSGERERERRVLDERVLGVWGGVVDVHNLSQSITLTFRKNSNITGIKGNCVFWKEINDESGYWSSDGCTTKFTGDNFVCSCNHLSFFAVLIDKKIDEVNARHLKYISYIGSSLSVVFTAITFLLFLYMRKCKSEQSTGIHVQLAVGLMFLHTFFLLSGWYAQTLSLQFNEPRRTCQALGMMLHWALLVTFTWMALEGFHLYLLLVRVFNIYVRRYLLKISLVGWGVPTVTVILCSLCGDYGLDRVQTNTTSSLDLCWITVNNGTMGKAVKYTTVHLYLGLVLVFNTAMLLLTLQRMWSIRGHGPKLEHKIWKDALSILGLSCALGLPWGLAFCSFGPLSLPGVYLFSILNGFQGVFLFLWFLALICKSHRVTQSVSSSQPTIKMSSLGT
ncbi:adhesion G-protein coupled receptor G5 isoform X2 [Denticeps clupeoides]|uniref:adhesion G-protein coupled receptor G5 isoform X2 n=1 Tax=Denticeps clupeoides TaxID=299321 RepID=UPI0010A4D858|nr:adhesion G-protein coupled receptor G5-like isoform X2 [Denticeps clupeoides]